MMTARFKIIKAYPVHSRNLYVLEGKITRGKIQPGMNLKYTDGRGRIALLPIEAIEFALYRINGRSSEVMCICLKYEDDEMLNVFRELRFSGRTFHILRPVIRFRTRAVYSINVTPGFARESRVGYGSARAAFPRFVPGEVLKAVFGSDDQEQMVVYEGRRSRNEGKFRTLDGKKIIAGKATMFRGGRIRRRGDRD